MERELCFLVCQHIKGEVEAIIKSDAEFFSDVRMTAFPSHCGKIPLELDKINTLLKGTESKININDYLQVHMLGSACVARFLKDAAPESLPKSFNFHKFNQCFYFLAPAPLIDQLLKERCYLVSPMSLKKWQTDMKEWGFSDNRDLAQEFFAQHTTRIVLLDTGIDQHSSTYLKEFAEFLDRPWQVIPVGLDRIKGVLEKIVLQWRLQLERAESEQNLKDSSQKTADYAMAMDFLGSLTCSNTESEVIRNILEMFSMLFAPGFLAYIPLIDGKPGQTVSLTPFSNEEKVIGKDLLEKATNLTYDYAWNDSGSGFFLQVKYREEKLGILIVDQIAFPGYMQHYLNLALAIIRECGLALDNARKYQQISEQKNRLSMTLKELELAKEEVEAANSVKASFLTRMSHELRTPLNGIIGMVNLLLNSKLEEKQQGFARFINSSANVLLTMINHIFDFTQIENGDLKMKKVNFNLEILLQETLQVLTLGAEEKGLELAHHIEPTVPLQVQGDPGRLQQVLINLLGNAIKFTHEGKISLNLFLDWEDHEKASLRFQVSDTGIGIPKRRIHSIFTAFSQVDTSSTRKYGGAGLGLSIAARLVEIMGGHIEVQSREKKGTTFSFSLVLKKQIVAAQATSEPAAVQPGENGVELTEAERNNACVLLVEDNIINRELMLELFRSEGIGSVLVARDGKEAIEIALKQVPDLVVMDIQMPVMDGNEATQHLRRQGFTGKIVALSACTIREEIAKTMEAGVDDYVTKPVDFDDFFIHIKKYLKKNA